MDKCNCSVFIQTLNEEKNLPRCLDSLTWSDDIVVLDSISTDRTGEIAKQYGARFYQRPYDGRANNQNWAVKNIKFKHDWVWYVDADEVTPKELAEEILRVTSDKDREEVCYFVQRNNMFMGKPLKHCCREIIARLWKPDCMSWERGANPIANIKGKSGYLKNRFQHYFFSKGYVDWINRHNKYSTYESIETIKALQSKDFKFTELFSGNPVIRRNAQKQLSYRLPCRPLFRFLHMYFWCEGFLDGKPGLIYSTLISIYEYFIVLKIKEIRLNEKNVTVR